MQVMLLNKTCLCPTVVPQSGEKPFKTIPVFHWATIESLNVIGPSLFLSLTVPTRNTVPPMYSVTLKR